jgi:dTMP kinase
MNNKRGKFIVFEGLDGSGKSTQTKLLSQYLQEKGYRVYKIDFPQYGTKSAGLVEEYLNGKYGTAKEVGAKPASIFYACDRYDASFKLRELLEKGFLVISDRYVASNIGHQGGKIENEKERMEYFKWLYNLEYNIFKIPKPDITFILKTSPELSLELSGNIEDKIKAKKKQLYLLNQKQDMHEKDLEHQKNALLSYLQIAREYPEEYIVIDCMDNGELLPAERVHDMIIKNLEKS